MPNIAVPPPALRVLCLYVPANHLLECFTPVWPPASCPNHKPPYWTLFGVWEETTEFSKVEIRHIKVQYIKGLLYSCMNDLINDVSRNSCNYCRDGINPSDGLTPLTPLQPAGCLTTLTPLQVPQDQHNQNGFHNSSTILDKWVKSVITWTLFS